MSFHPLLSDLISDSHWLGMGLLLPVAAGVVAGLGVVGTIHYFTRVGKKVPEAPKEERPGSDPFVNGSTNEHRKSFRRKGNPVEILVIDQSIQAAAVKGYVVNRSVGGICVQMDSPMEINAELTVRATNAPHIAPWVEVVVTNCRKAEVGYHIGCQFVRTPPWPVLMTFG
jgi:hypothetical protein